MPAALVKKYAEKQKMPLSDAEHRWEKAKKIVEKQYDKTEDDGEEFFKLVVGVFKKAMGVNIIAESADTPAIAFRAVMENGIIPDAAPYIWEAAVGIAVDQMDPDSFDPDSPDFKKQVFEAFKAGLEAAGGTGFEDMVFEKSKLWYDAGGWLRDVIGQFAGPRDTGKAGSGKKKDGGSGPPPPPNGPPPPPPPRRDFNGDDTDPPPKPKNPAENIKNGLKQMRNIIANDSDERNVMFRAGMGWLAMAAGPLMGGREGGEFLAKLASTIARGSLERELIRNNRTERDIEHNGMRARFRSFIDAKKRKAWGLVDVIRGRGRDQVTESAGSGDEFKKKRIKASKQRAAQIIKLLEKTALSPDLSKEAKDEKASVMKKAESALTYIEKTRQYFPEEKEIQELFDEVQKKKISFSDEYHESRLLKLEIKQDIDNKKSRQSPIITAFERAYHERTVNNISQPQKLEPWIKAILSAATVADIEAVFRGEGLIEDVEAGKEPFRAIPEGYTQAKKQPDGTYRLFFTGTRNEVFPGEVFKSAQEARGFLKANNLKAHKGISKRISAQAESERKFNRDAVIDKLFSSPRNEKENVVNGMSIDDAKEAIARLDAAPGDDPDARKAIYARFPELAKEAGRAEAPKLTPAQKEAQKQMEPGYKAVASRMDAAVKRFIESVVEQFGFTEDEARKILERFKKEKLVKLNSAMGRYDLKDGRAWDKGVMRRALGKNKPTGLSQKPTPQGWEEKDLDKKYKTMAEYAFDAGIRSTDEDALLPWIRENSNYDIDKEFFIYLGVAAELGDLIAKSEENSGKETPAPVPPETNEMSNFSKEEKAQVKQAGKEALKRARKAGRRGKGALSQHEIDKIRGEAETNEIIKIRNEKSGDAGKVSSWQMNNDDSVSDVDKRRSKNQEFVDKYKETPKLNNTAKNLTVGDIGQIITDIDLGRITKKDAVSLINDAFGSGIITKLQNEVYLEKLGGAFPAPTPDTPSISSKLKDFKFTISADDRPADIPDDWPVLNAPRPIPGTKTWKGEFAHGIFYSAIDPADDMAERMIEDAQGLDAYVVEFMSTKQAENFLMAYAKKHYDKDTIESVKASIESTKNAEDREKIVWDTISGILDDDMTFDGFLEIKNSVPGAGNRFDEIQGEIENRKAAETEWLSKHTDTALKGKTKDGKRVVSLTKSARTHGRWQITRFDNDGPMGHIEHDTYEEAVKDLHSWGFDWNTVEAVNVQKPPAPDTPETGGEENSIAFPLKQVEDAYRHISMNPKNAAMAEKDQLENIAKALKTKLEKHTPEGREDEIGPAIEQFKRDYISARESVWSARSAGMSSAVAGRSKYNIKQADRRNKSIDSAENDFSYRLKDIESKAMDATGAADAKAEQERAAAEKKEKSKADKEAIEIVAMLKGIKNGTMAGYDPNLFKQSFIGKMTTMLKNGRVDDVEKAMNLVNNLASKDSDIGKPVFTPRHSLWKKIAEKRESMNKPAEKKGWKTVATFDDSRVEITADYDADQVQIAFDYKPDEDVRNALKSAGFKWARSRGEWIKKLSDEAIEAAKRILGKEYDEDQITESTPPLPNSMAVSAAAIRARLAEIDEQIEKHHFFENAVENKILNAGTVNEIEEIMIDQGLIENKKGDKDSMINISDQIKNIIETAEENDIFFDHFGLRAVTNNVDVGDILDNSYVWIDNERTDQELDGTSAIEIDPNNIKRALKKVLKYHGDQIVLIGGNVVSWGEDEDEIIIQDAEVVAGFNKKTIREVA